MPFIFVPLFRPSFYSARIKRKVFSPSLTRENISIEGIVQKASTLSDSPPIFTLSTMNPTALLFLPLLFSLTLGDASKEEEDLMIVAAETLEQEVRSGKQLNEENNNFQRRIGFAALPPDHHNSPGRKQQRSDRPSPRDLVSGRLRKLFYSQGLIIW